MTHSIFLLQAWVDCWGLKCKKEMRDDEADSFPQMYVLQGKDRFSSPFVLGTSGAYVSKLV